MRHLSRRCCSLTNLFWSTSGLPGAAPAAHWRPIVDEVAAAYQGKLKVMKMDVDRNSATPMRYGIRGIPALLLFKGGKVAEQIVGYVPKDTIDKSVDKLIATYGRRNEQLQVDRRARQMPGLFCV